MGNTNSNKNVALKAGAWYVVSNIVVKAISVITAPIFTRIMTTAEYGTVQTFVAWHSLLLPVFTLCLEYSIGRAKLDYPGKMDEYLGSMVTLSSLISMALSVCIFIFIHPVSKLFELTPSQTIILITYLFFQITIVFYQNLYRYNYKYKQNIAIAWYTALSSTILSIVLIFTIKENKADLRMLGIAIPIVLLSLYFWAKSIKGKMLSFNREYWKYGLAISMPLVLHTMSMHILSQADRVFIAKICGPSDTAFYGLAYTYGVLLHVFTTAVSQAWLPWFHDTYFDEDFESIRKNVKPLVIAGCYIGLASIAFAPEAILILGGHKYASSVPCVPPIVLGIVCQYIYTHYVNIELHLKKTVYVSNGTIAAACINIVTNAIFIPRFGFVAAAYTTLASYFALMLIHFTITKKVLKVNLYDDLFMFGALAVTGIVTAILVQTYEHTLIRYCLILIGFASFLYYFRGYIGNFLKMRRERGGKNE